MRTVIVCAASLAVAGLFSVFPRSLADPEVNVHPRLILTDARIADLYAQTHPTGPIDSWTERQRVSRLAYGWIVAAAERHLAAPYNNPLHEAWVGQEWPLGTANQGIQASGLQCLALAYHITRDTRYSNHAIALMEAWRRPYYWQVSNPGSIGPNRIDFPQGFPCWGGQGTPTFSYVDRWLGLGDLTTSWALAYDWLYSEMTSQQRNNGANALKALIKTAFNAEQTMGLGYWAMNYTYLFSRVTNGLGVTGGGLGLATLALYQHTGTSYTETTRLQHLAKAQQIVGEYFDGGFDAQGAGKEGTLYAGYGGHNALPFALAIERIAAMGGPETDTLRVRALRNVQQAANWFGVYEPLPYDSARCTLLNDSYDRGTISDRLDMWPSLMAFGNPGRPSAARHFLDIAYPPARRVAALQRGGELIHPEDDSKRAVWILLGYPEVEGDGSFQSPSSMGLRLGRWFQGRGLAMFRTGFHAIDGQGNLNGAEAGGSLIAFESREPPPPEWGQGYWCRGHAQNDLNHFQVYSMGAPLFFDSGYGGGATSSHNCTVLDGKGPEAFARPGDPQYAYANMRKQGHIDRFLWAQGNAPALVTGNSTQAWGELGPGASYIGPLYADWVYRHFFVIPRATGRPYLLFYDDLEVGPYFPGQQALATWHWHGGVDPATSAAIPFRNPGTGGLIPTPPELPSVANSARFANGNATAQMTVLSPPAPQIALSQILIDLDNSTPDHYRLDVSTTAERQNADLVVLVDLSAANEAPQPLAASADLDPASQNFVYQITDGPRLDLAALRRHTPAGQGPWQFEIDGQTLSTDAQHVVLRFSDKNVLTWETIDAGTMVAGSYLEYGGKPVMRLETVSGIQGSMTFSKDEVCVMTNTPGDLRGYAVCPVRPTLAYVNGQAQAVDMRSVTVYKLQPSAGSESGGTLVMIEGTGFTNSQDTSVTFGSVPASGVSVLSSYQILAVAPPYPGGEEFQGPPPQTRTTKPQAPPPPILPFVDITVRNSRGTWTLRDGFTYLPPQ